MTTLFLSLFALEGLLLMVVSVPLIRRKVAPNPIYGFRIPKTLASERVWYDANAYAGRELFRAGAEIVAGAALLRLVPTLAADFVLYNVACAVVILAALGVAVGRSFRFAQTL